MSKCRHNSALMILRDEDTEALQEWIDEWLQSKDMLEELKLDLNCDILDYLRRYLSKEMLKPKHCPNCGGMLPELAFRYKDRTFQFTCYMIKENNKVIAKTDYSKFAKYCRAIEKKE